MLLKTRWLKQTSNADDDSDDDFGCCGLLPEENESQREFDEDAELVIRLEQGMSYRSSKRESDSSTESDGEVSAKISTSHILNLTHCAIAVRST